MMMDYFNMLDLVILGIVVLCAFAGYRRGLIRTVYRLASFFVAIFLAWQLYPHAANFLRGTVLFTWIRDGIIRGMNLETFFNEHATAQGTEMIEQLPLPDMLRTLLLNHIPDNMFDVLNVAAIEDYIASFFAGITINTIAILLMFTLISIVLAIVGAALDIISYLPVINTFNKAGGLALGAIMGVILAWVVILFMTVILAAGSHDGIFELLDGSFLASFMNDILLPRLADAALNNNQFWQAFDSIEYRWFLRNNL